MVTTVYHAGDFKNKAIDTDLKNSAPGRSTGFFGTGYYFCTTPEKCARQGYIKDNPRPIYSFSIEGLNLYYGTLDRHEKLKTVCEIISWWPWMSIDIKLWWSLLYHYEKIFPYYNLSGYEKIEFGNYLKENYEYEHEEHPDLFPTFTSYFGDMYNEKQFIECCKQIPELVELANQLSSDNPDYEKITEIVESSDYFDKQWYNNIDSCIQDLNTVYYSFCDSKEEFLDICNRVSEKLKPYYGSHNTIARGRVPYGLDSVTTLFLKELGYEGVYPDSDCDNISYGGVVYDMPKDIKLVTDNQNNYIHNNMKRKLFNKLISSSSVYRIYDYNTDVGYVIKDIFHKVFPDTKFVSFSNPSPSGSNHIVAEIKFFNPDDANFVLQYKDDLINALNSSKVYSAWGYKAFEIKEVWQGSTIAIRFMDTKIESSKHVFSKLVKTSENENIDKTFEKINEYSNNPLKGTSDLVDKTLKDVTKKLHK